MVAQPSPRYISVEEWRKLERTSHDIKHEYIDGHAYAMTGGSLDHSRIGSNVVRTFEDALGDGPCVVYNSDAAVRLSSERYVYPDATITCDEGDQGRITEIQSPRVIVEVLSNTTEGYDRGRKFAYCRACPTVQEYVLVGTAYQVVEVFRRTPEGWAIYRAYGPGDTIELASIRTSFPLAALYRRTTVPETLNAPEGEV